MSITWEKLPVAGVPEEAIRKAVFEMIQAVIAVWRNEVSKLSPKRTGALSASVQSRMELGRGIVFSELDYADINLLYRRNVVQIAAANIEGRMISRLDQILKAHLSQV